MKKLLFILLLLPFISKGQLFTSFDIGTTGGTTLKVSPSVGIRFFGDDTIEFGYVYERLLNNSVQHNVNYNGFRFHAQTQLFEKFGAYMQYDFLRGTRYLYEDASASSVKPFKKFFGDPVIGAFYNGGANKPLSFYLGVTPYIYSPRNYEIYGNDPLKSATFVLKIKYSLHTNIYP